MDRYPDEAAAILEASSIEDVIGLLSSLPLRQAVSLLEKLTPELASRAIDGMSGELAAKVIPHTNPNRATSLIARLHPDRQESILAPLDPSLAKELKALAQYTPDSAGGLMDPRVMTFRPDALPRDVIRRLRSLRKKRIQEIYLVDTDGKLVGSVALQDIVLAQPGDRLQDLSAGLPPHVHATDSRDEVNDRLSQYSVTSLPVVDFDQRILGVLRQNQLVAAAQQSATANIQTMVGASREERALSSPLFAVRKRLPWLEVNLLTAFLAAAVVGIFEDTIARFTALAVLLPVVAGQSGNTGAQALAVTMRGLALREIRLRHWLRVSSKEVLVGAVNGVAVALTTSVAVLIWSHSTGLAMVIGVSMVLSMTIAGLAGAVIPVLLTAIGQDPAQSSSIFLTTVTDVVGFFSFLGIATMLAPML